MNKTYKYTLSAGEKKEITFGVGVQRLAVTNANGEDGNGVTYTAGENIQISEENVISAKDTTYTAGDGIAISEQNVISNTAKENTDIIAEEYDSTKAYAVGDYCIYDNKLYRCISAITESKWHKVPCDWYNPSSTWSRSYTSENECYACLNAEGMWGIIFASKTQSAIINWTGAGGYGSYDLNQTYSGGVENIYYRGEYGGMYTDTTLDGSNAHYTSEASALADLDRTFNVSNWTEVTVTDEIKHYRYSYSTDEHVVGTWTNGKDIYERTIIFIGVSRGRYQISHNIPNIEFVVGYEYIFDQSPSDPEWFRSLPEAVTDLYAIFVSGVSTTQIDYRYGTSWSVDPDLHITIRYTKTTN